MKSLASLLLLACLGDATLSAQSYSINWFTCDGGGGTSKGSGYTLRGTVGQPDASALTGGGYSLFGGYWSGIGVVQTEGAPLIQITRSGAAVNVTWPQTALNWLLESTADLTIPSNLWTQIPPPYQIGGTNFVFTESAPNGCRFYRLRKP